MNAIQKTNFVVKMVHVFQYDSDDDCLDQTDERHIYEKYMKNYIQSEYIWRGNLG